MEQQDRHDLNICGVGKATGGVFGKVRVEGTASFAGDIDCLDFIVEGVAKGRGNVKARSARIEGVVTMDGSWQSERLTVTGHARITGDVSVRQIRSEGFTGLGGNVAAEEVEISGRTRIKGNCQAESFVARGAFGIDGMLNAGNIDVLAVGKCRARDVGGEKIRVTRGHPNILARLLTSVLTGGTGFVAETVEGDDVDLEYARAKAVRGNYVRIGPGCVVDLVEYRDDFWRDDGARIKAVTKTNLSSFTNGREVSGHGHRQPPDPD